MGSAIGYKICSVDGSKLFRSESMKFDYSFSLLQNNGRPNLERFDAVLGDNLDLRYLEDKVYPRYKDKMKGKNLFFKNGKYKSTVALINVTFDCSIREFDDKGKGLFACSKRTINRELLDDHVYIENGELIAIEVIDPDKRDLKNYKPVKEAIKSELLGEYFIFDAETRAYRLKREEKTDRITGKKKAGDNKIKPTVSKEKIRKTLYHDGFTVDGIHYVRYKRSAGSSRDGSCLFIAEPLYDDMMKWSRCEIDGEAIKDQASWQAYISLTLSDIVETLAIPKSAIMIVPDADIEGTDEVINITRGESKNGETVSLRGARETVTYENKIWDGEALLDESVFEEFDRKLAEKENSPNAKKHGMLLLRNRMFKTCAFRTRLQKYFIDNGIDDLTKLGGYAPYAKTVEDIKLVVTESSVKYIKLLGMLEPDLSIAERFKKWLDVIYKSPSGKNFGVVKYDKATGPMNNRCAYTNYQLINTLDINREGIKLLLRDSLDLLHKTQTDPLYLRYYTQISAIVENEYVDEEEEEREIEVTGNARRKLISELFGLSDLAFKLQIYKDYRKDVTDQFKKKLKRGRIVVEGNYSTLFGNPLEYLRRTIERDYVPNEPIEGSLSDGQIYTKRFNDGETLLCARSPHITMGNVYVAVNKYVPEIDEYFELGDANTIVCVNAIQSNIQQRLNGCDYDSDAMLITNNPILLDAARGHKELFPVPYCSISENDVPDIVENMKKKKDLTDIICEVDINISNNKVGEIVNLSQFLNSLYWECVAAGESEDELEKLYVDICKLAVLSGIEIDKAKRDMKISAQSVISSVRLHKDEYAKNKEGLPKFFVELTGGDRSRISKEAVLRSPLSHIFDIVSEDGGQNSSEHTIRYDVFFDIPKCAYDQGAKRRGYEDFYNYSVEINKKLISKNISAKKHSTNKNVEVIYDSTEDFLIDALEGAKKYLKSPSDYYYALQRIMELTREGKRVFVPLYLLCFANNGWLLGRIPKSPSLMHDLIQDDTLNHDDSVVIYGHPHKLCAAKRKSKFVQG